MASAQRSDERAWRLPLRKPGQMRWQSLRQVARLSSAARYQFTADMPPRD